jgi:beta-glucosidase
VAAAHHLMLSHGWAVETIRRAAPEAQVGITLNLSHAYPASDAPEDEAAAWQVDGEGNRWFLDPIFRGAYPADLLERNELVAPFVRDGDLEAISAPLDFLGVNNYFRFVVSAGANGPRMQRDSDAQHTDMGWEVYPDGLNRLLVRVARDYSPPAIYVTENGAAFGDVRVHDGHVHDPERTEYIEAYIAAVSDAIADGAPVKGYFVWSLLDNFEWAYGYSKRFGIVYIDYPTLERVPKDSFYWYRDFITSMRGAPRPSPIAAR